MKSIRQFLVITTLALLVLVVFMSAVQGFRSSMIAAENQFDSQLQEQAHFAANLPSGIIVDTGSNAHIAYQLWRAPINEPQVLLSRTDNAPVTAITDFEPGFHFSNFSHYRWRTYTYYLPENELVVIAAARTDVRYKLAENIIIEAILPIVLWLPLSGLLIWLVIGRGLQPLKILAGQLRLKESDDLSKIELPARPKELDQVVNSVNALLARLQAAFDREKRFASDAAHELRTPISALKIQAHNLAASQPEQSSEIQQLESGIERMQHLVEQILALHRASPEQLTARFESLNLYDLCQQVIADHYEAFENREQHIELTGNDSDEKIYAPIKGDRFALETLVLNLLNNANKYTPPGGHIQVDVGLNKGQIALHVQDNGPGIPLEERERIFERFHRVGSDRHSSGQIGCGLGLAIVKNIASVHGAEIQVSDSPWSSGVCFTVNFPAEETS